MWFLYIVQCKDGSLYTGITNDVYRRVNQHNSGAGAKSVRSKLPVILVYFEKYSLQSEAAKREQEIKGWRREKKLKLIKGFTLRHFVPKGA